jgi:hypothetical protein
MKAVAYQSNGGNTLNPMKATGLIPALLLAVALAALAGDAKPIYTNDFEKAALDSVPDDMLVIDGGFAVKEEGGNKFLELPGAPVDSYGILFGPTQADGVSVSARIHSTGKGRRYSTFGVGLGGVSGYRFQLSPAKKSVELMHNDNLVASVPYEWTSDTWTSLRLQVRKVKEGQWKIEGKAWKHGSKEPGDWTLTADEKEAPVAGRASIWGMPFSGTPIRYDDLALSAIAQ